MKLPALDNGWTGGQYSFFRVLFGTYLFVHFAHLIPWGAEVFSSAGMLSNAADSPLIYLFPNILALVDGPVFVQLFIASGALAALFLLVGAQPRIAALWMFFVLACLFGRNPLIANPSMPYVGWILLAHLFIPPAPYGSFTARNRTADPAGDWVMPKDVFTAAWLILALTYSYSGYTKLLSPSWVSGDNIAYVLDNPLARDYFLRDFFLSLPPVCLKILTWSVLYIELLFAPLALFKKLRPVMWGLMMFIQFGFAFLLNFFDLTSAMLLLHIFTFDPAWVKGKAIKGTPILFYDGMCGLCHKTIRFLLTEDVKRKIVQYAPLQGETFVTRIPQEKRKYLPDSIVLLLDDGRMLTKTSAVVYLLRYLGGGWRLVAILLWAIPRPIRNLGYDIIGAIRNALFHRPETLCPLMPEEMKSRFLA